MASAVVTDALKYAAEQQKRLGDTLLRTIGRGAQVPNDFRSFVESGEVDLPLEDLQVSRTSILQRMSSLTQAFEREYGRKTKKVKAKKKTPTLKVGVCVFTWQSK